eukprot:3358948-Prymnesium_polylepis.1
MARMKADAEAEAEAKQRLAEASNSVSSINRLRRLHPCFIIMRLMLLCASLSTFMLLSRATYSAFGGREVGRSKMHLSGTNEKPDTFIRQMKQNAEHGECRGGNFGRQEFEMESNRFKSEEECNYCKVDERQEVGAGAEIPERNAKEAGQAAAAAEAA